MFPHQRGGWRIVFDVDSVGLTVSVSVGVSVAVLVCTIPHEPVGRF